MEMKDLLDTFGAGGQYHCSHPGASCKGFDQTKAKDYCLPRQCPNCVLNNFLEGREDEVVRPTRKRYYPGD